MSFKIRQYLGEQNNATGSTPPFKLEAGQNAAPDDGPLLGALHSPQRLLHKTPNIRADQGLRLFAEAPSAERIYKEQIGDMTVNVRVYSKGGQRQDLIFINLHHSEKTSVQAARRIADEVGGMVVDLVHPGGRLVTFKLHGKSYTFDPNRIFTDAGIEKTLRGYSRSAPPAAKMAVKQFAEALIEKYVRNRRVIMAVHNNSGGFKVDLWDKNGRYEKDTAEIFKGDPKHPHNFFIVTTMEDFNLLKSYGYNVVRQNNEHATDDGSLSIFCGRHNIRYINVEAQHGDELGQKSMLRTMAVNSRSAEDGAPSQLQAGNAAKSQPAKLDAANIRRLVKATESKDARVREDALNALGKIGKNAIPDFMGI